MVDYREAIEVLIEMLEKYDFEEKEKQTIKTAIGTLDWGAFAKSRQKRIIKAKKNKN